MPANDLTDPQRILDSLHECVDAIARLIADAPFPDKDALRVMDEGIRTLIANGRYE